MSREMRATADVICSDSLSTMVSVTVMPPAGLWECPDLDREFRQLVAEGASETILARSEREEPSSLILHVVTAIEET